MHIQKLLNIMKLQGNLSDSRAYTAIGQIINFDPINYLVDVELLAADSDSPALTTGFIALASPWVGNGWGMFCPPSIGDLCDVHFQEAQLQNPYASLRFYGLANVPLNVPQGEFWLVHQTGTYIKLMNDGSVNINAQSNINLTSTTQINLTAPEIVLNSAEVNLGSGTLSELMNATAVTIYNEHTHSDPQGGDTGVPNQQMDHGDLTTNVKGS
jgi:uncharacterized protein involved in type VI secretion and phage assembly